MQRNDKYKPEDVKKKTTEEETYRETVREVYQTLGVVRGAKLLGILETSQANASVQDKQKKNAEYGPFDKYPSDEDRALAKYRKYRNGF